MRYTIKLEFKDKKEFDRLIDLIECEKIVYAEVRK